MPPRLNLKLGLIINPFAGVGGPSAHKGSDALAIQQAAARGELALTAQSRVAVFLQMLRPLRGQLEMWTVAGAMGEQSCADAGWPYQLTGYRPSSPSSFRDTEEAAKALHETGVDLLVFAGGDGTARDVCRVVGQQQVALGIPAGVKMQSGVYAVNPQAAAEVVRQWAAGELVTVAEREVRDIDEAALAEGVVKSRYFGSMRVPDEARYVQQVKQGGREVEELVLADIAADIAESLDDDRLLIFGPGSTTHGVLQHLGLPATLLGVDLYRGEEPLLLDADAQALQACLNAHAGSVALYVTAIGGQGHVIGRGNQQLTPSALRRIGRENLHILATRSKLNALEGRPLLIDSGDPGLDTAWSGFVTVTTGYRDAVLYPIIGTAGNSARPYGDSE